MESTVCEEEEEEEEREDDQKVLWWTVSPKTSMPSVNLQ